MLSPTITLDENSREVMLDNGRATKFLSHLERYEYASIEHMVRSLMWQTMMRIGGDHSLDVDDFHPDDQYIEARYRPETGTRVKSKQHGERPVALSDQICELLDDWLTNKRPEVTDKSGRNPLLASQKNRIGTTTLRKYVYRWTHPCIYNHDCPHWVDRENCEGLEHGCE